MEVKCHDVSSIRNHLNLGQFWSHEWEPTSFLLQPKIISQINFFCSLFTRSNGISCPNWIFGRSLYSWVMQKSWVNPTSQHLRLCGVTPISRLCSTMTALQSGVSQLWNLRPWEFYLQYVLNNEGCNTNARFDQFMFAKHIGEGK